MVARSGGTHPYTPRTSPQPTRLIKDPDDLETQFDALVDGLRRDVRRTRQQVEKFSRAYQRMAEAQSGRSSEGELDEATQRSYRRLKQLQLVVQHIESSVSYLLGSGIEPEVHGGGEKQLDVAQRVLESLEAERERLYRDVHDGPAQVLANAIFEVDYLERIAERAPAELRQTLRSELATLRGQFRASLDSVRAMIYDLRPPELTELGLADAMRNYASEWETRCGIKVEQARHGRDSDVATAGARRVSRSSGGPAERAQARAGVGGGHRVAAVHGQLGPARHRRRHRLR